MICSRGFWNNLSVRRSVGMAVAVLLSACAPEPTTPADTNLAGVWKSNAHVFDLSQIELTLIQEPRGIVSGGWSAKRDGCPNLCDASGSLIGRNMVSQIELELVGTAKFEGQFIEPNRLRGSLLVGIRYDSITFVK